MDCLRPRVSMGLPVYNGENYLAEALDSLLAQTFQDFELIIRDNASTDGTETICREYAERDRRIRYFRNPRNIGAAPNFNLVFRQARGEYFKWCAHDDVCAPEFLTRCVDVLDWDESAVLAYPKTMIIDEKGDPVQVYGRKLATDSPEKAVRFQALLEGHNCYEVFGLIRRDVLERTPLIGGYAHGDGVLLARLGLHGRFVEIPEMLFFARRHARQSMTMVNDYQSYAVWFNPALRGKRRFPYWRIHGEWLRAALEVPMSDRDRRRCLRMLVRSFRRRKKLLVDELRSQFIPASDWRIAR